MSMKMARWILALALLSVAQSAFAGWAAMVIPAPPSGSGSISYAAVSEGNVLVEVLVPEMGWRTQMWQHDTSTYVDLNGSQNPVMPSDMSGSIIVGRVSQHPAYWTGSADNAVYLHTPECSDPTANGVSGDMIVGSGFGWTERGDQGAYTYHAGYWTDRGATWHDIHPAEYCASEANATDGVQQVVWAASFLDFPVPIPEIQQACVWSGTKESFANLHPPGAFASEALGVSDGIQVGWTEMPNTINKQHAALWRGNAESLVDLNPPGAVSSMAVDAFGDIQVGYARTEDTSYGMLWRGSASSAVNLQQFLPKCYNASTVSAIGTGPNGETWVLGFASDYATGKGDMVIWYMVPEPCSLTVLAIGLVPIGAFIGGRKRVSINH